MNSRRSYTAALTLFILTLTPLLGACNFPLPAKGPEPTQELELAPRLTLEFQPVPRPTLTFEPAPGVTIAPPCSLEDLVEPELYRPEDGATVNAVRSTAGDRPELRWWHPHSPYYHCMPERVQIELSTDSDFAEISLIHQTAGFVESWQVDTDLQEDTHYFWRVAVMAEGQLGPYSETWTFFAQGVPEGLPGVIAGRVWHDLCANPIPRDSLPPDAPLLPQGCIDFNGSVMANGIMEDGEPGIDHVIVKIADGACPPSDDHPSSHETGHPGPDWPGWYYRFVPQGTYCVYIDENEDPNDGRLQLGVWTYPIPEGPAQTTVVIEEDGQIVDEVNFGWDFTYAPEFEDVEGSISGLVWYDLNGNGIPDADEPGIYYAEVRYVHGECDVDWAERWYSLGYTWEDGSFRRGSWGGTWCILVDPQAEWFNQQYFERGYWTYPIESEVEGVAAVTVTLGWDEHLTGVNFGWHYPPYVIADKNVNCRFGPGTVYDVVDYLMEGDKRWLEGRNANNTWWWTEDHCWVADSVVSFYGNPGELPIIAAPPTPTPPPSEDTVPPLVEITHDPPNPDINDLVTFSATASDNVGVARIEIWVKPPGTEVVFKPSTVCENSTKCTYIGGTYSQGQGEYYAKAWDDAGNMGISVTHGFVVSGLP